MLAQRMNLKLECARGEISISEPLSLTIVLVGPTTALVSSGIVTEQTV